ncbi:UDP-N-acetylmuramoyl-L-alanyl-D-glutamate--2,6-diaminopimelate ligase [Lacticaseibacillus zhaodongensis]|uniref:UDP-N-acetylmuramoyl-L-alanyl-D-glutamate--2, 6-diaminopimelate ligase n=1 Tax=Lacticaseibacillus zhaodongensis TaxID=2668065 RepID=UPI0012D36851|nr:UDP-N-acetylmuramoyl-L-alanyl-D-glutamate--2,6-diaminopimelate ligase [Lacticaseibacillus zhaodongensis]
MLASDLCKYLFLDPPTRSQLRSGGLVVTSLTATTQAVRPGSCYVAIKGENFDGHEHLAEVFAAGATLAVVEQPVAREFADRCVRVANTHKALAQLAQAFYCEPSRELNVVGVTGTNGKTTITQLFSQVLEGVGVRTGVIGTLNIRDGNRIVPTCNTTPDALTMAAEMRAMVANGVRTCALEVSSVALDQGRSWGLDFDTTIFTNLTEDHLDYHGTMANYYVAKSKLFIQNAAFNGRAKTAIINGDDDYGRKLVELATGTAVNVITYAIDTPATVRAQHLQMSAAGTTFSLLFGGQEYVCTIPLLGKFNVYNVLAVFAAAYVQGLTVEQIIAALAQVHGAPGRMQLLQAADKITGIVDYAHTPDGLEKVLSTLKQLERGRIICVFGCGGDRDHGKRPLMAAIAVHLADVAIITSDNPRSEDPEQIVAEMVGQLAPQQYRLELNRAKAIKLAVSLAQPGDVVLVAGKGHEDYQIIGSERLHFDDREVLAAALQERF